MNISRLSLDYAGIIFLLSHLKTNISEIIVLEFEPPSEPNLQFLTLFLEGVAQL